MEVFMSTKKKARKPADRTGPTQKDPGYAGESS